MILFLVFLAGLFLALVVWMADLPLRPPTLPRKSEREHERAQTSTLLGMRVAIQSAQGGKLNDEMFLADMQPKQVRRQRVLFALGAMVFVGGAVFILLSPVIALAASVIVGVLGWFLPTMTVRSGANNFRFELLQALPQFLSLAAIAMTSLTLSDSIKHASLASDHRTFVLFRSLIPPPNSASTFGDELFEFGRKYNIPEFTVRGNILITAAREGGRNVRSMMQEQANVCRQNVNAQLEEDITGRVTAGSASSMAIIMGVFVFILYPVSQQLSGGFDPADFGEERTEQIEESG